MNQANQRLGIVTRRRADRDVAGVRGLGVQLPLLASPVSGRRPKKLVPSKLITSWPF
jgi:hypothetical protein